MENSRTLRGQGRVLRARAMWSKKEAVSIQLFDESYECKALNGHIASENGKEGSMDQRRESKTDELQDRDAHKNKRKSETSTTSTSAGSNTSGQDRENGSNDGNQVKNESQKHSGNSRSNSSGGHGGSSNAKELFSEDSGDGNYKEGKESNSSMEEEYDPKPNIHARLNEKPAPGREYLEDISTQVVLPNQGRIIDIKNNNNRESLQKQFTQDLHSGSVVDETDPRFQQTPFSHPYTQDGFMYPNQMNYGYLPNNMPPANNLCYPPNQQRFLPGASQSQQHPYLFGFMYSPGHNFKTVHPSMMSNHAFPNGFQQNFKSSEVQAPYMINHAGQFQSEQPVPQQRHMSHAMVPEPYNNKNVPS